MSKTQAHASRANRLSRRASLIQPFHVMEIMRHAEAVEARGVRVIHLELGEPSFDTPAPIMAAGRKALDEGLTHYTRAVGIEPLRKRIASYYQEHLDVDLDWQRVAITAGASSGLLMALATVLDTEDEILLSDPGYPCYPNYVSLLGSRFRYIELQESNGFILTKTQLAAAWKAQSRALLLASPANPTGATLSQEQMREISDYVMEKEGALLMDEIYQGLNYGDRQGLQSILQVNPDAIVINSFSKFFGMTGWRIGWSVLPDNLVTAFERIAQNLTISPTTMSQFAALEAFSPETLAIAESRRQAFSERRDYLLDALRKLGFGIPHSPEGAFYIYANIDAFGKHSHDFCLDVLDKVGVAITPGLDFSASQHQRYVRFAYTPSMEDLQEAVDRLSAYLGNAL